ncbi:hypothetical protein DE146DRAFT_224874 [Phaeosphaeria sp. MPI-PUGE-AT-0046c]|nr:hypothetical protein DE146DRAFT_224874 [Phaeosphaeria sp. MPI-PUGE-AT-0046c]
MSRIVRAPQEILTYNAAYCVLICRECQYAIQKNAISSHLLRHKIYREERQRLLSYVSDLHLLDPEDVITPARGAPPIEGLSVIPGYCCTRRGCGSLCASIKRMKRHQSESHKETDLRNYTAFARSVRLQTFFRGTKLKYFEVTSGLAEDDSAVPSIEARSITHEDDNTQAIVGDIAFLDQEISSSEDIVLGNASVDYASSGLSDRSPSQRTTSRPESIQSLDHTPELNLEAMTYFRLFLTATSAGLPAPYDGLHAWSTSVVDHALKHQWLMYGLLALSAYQLAVTSVDADNREIHGRNGTQYASEFSNGLNLELVKQQIFHGNDLSAIGDRIHHLLMCAHWAVSGSFSDVDQPNSRHTPFGIKPLLEILSNLAQWSTLPRPDVPGQEAIYSRAKTILEFGDEDIGDLDPTYFRLLHCLGRLPARLSDALGRPDRVQEVLATLAATSALVIGCEVSFASDVKEAAWHGMVSWMAMFPQHFHDMLMDNNPTALVLLVYWSALVSRAERVGFWFLDGLAERIIHEVDERLAADRSGLRVLVQEFTS